MVQHLTVYIEVNLTQYDCSSAPIFDVTSFSFMSCSKPYIYSEAAWYNNFKLMLNLMHLYNGKIFVFTLLYELVYYMTAFDYDKRISEYF